MGDACAGGLNGRDEEGFRLGGGAARGTIEIVYARQGQGKRAQVSAADSQVVCIGPLAGWGARG